MDWNPDPKVAAARDIAAQFDKDMVIVLMIHVKDGTLEYASYGRTKALCAQAEQLADHAFDVLMENV